MKEKSLATISPDNDSDNALKLVCKAIKTDPMLQPSTKEQYIKALKDYADTGRSLLSPDDLQEYCLAKPNSTKSFLRAGINRLAQAYERQVKLLVNPLDQKEVSAAQGMIMKVEILADSIKIKTDEGEKVGNWLSGPELQALISLTRNNGSTTLIQLRDRVSLGLMSNGMLRRQEVVDLQFSDINKRDGYTILEVCGKGNKTRGVKLTAGLAQDIQALEEILKSGYVIRAILQRKNGPKGYTKIGDYWVGKNISSQSLYNICLKYGKLIDRDLHPHDLRRTGAKIAYNGNVPLDQISLALGHASIETTMTYIGTDRDWDLQPCDFVPY